jgi:hypothetical protein
MSQLHILVTLDGEPMIDAMSEDQSQEELHDVVRQFLNFLHSGVTEDTQLSVIGQD